jgi:hypothetical protein
MRKDPVADGRTTIGAKSEPKRTDALVAVKKRELGGLGVLPPCHGALDDVVGGDAAVVEPTTDLRVVECRFDDRDVRGPERTQRDNNIPKRWIRWAQIHHAGS